MKWFKLLFFICIGVLYPFLFDQAVFAQNQSQKILLSPNYQEMPLGAGFKVDVLIVSEETLIGADVKIDYDDRVLEVISIDSGEAFDMVPKKVANEGVISITGLKSQAGSPFYGIGRLATLNLKTIGAGDTTLRTQFEPEKTTDSNLTTAQVKDILEQAEDSSFAIGSSFQKVLGSTGRFVLKAAPLFIFLIFVGIAAYVVYRWWRYQKENPEYNPFPRKYQYMPLEKTK